MANALDLITKLLAKAESTTPEEAEALIAKAQELATTYAIEQAVIDAARAVRGEAREGFKQIKLCTERNTKLIKAKRHLVMYLADVNSCFVVMGPRRAYLEVSGHESDVAMLENLFASLLLQMQRSMLQAEARGLVVGQIGEWRVSYAHGYVRRVGYRMMDAKNASVRAADAGTPRYRCGPAQPCPAEQGVGREPVQRLGGRSSHPHQRQERVWSHGGRRGWPPRRPGRRAPGRQHQS
jgi:hypothetical protein